MRQQGPLHTCYSNTGLGVKIYMRYFLADKQVMPYLTAEGGFINNTYRNVEFSGNVVKNARLTYSRAGGAGLLLCWHPKPHYLLSLLIPAAPSGGFGHLAFNAGVQLFFPHKAKANN